MKMEINLEVCRTIAVQYGLPLQFVVKEFYVFDVLGQIAALTAGKTELVFKGGTALNKVYLGKMQRFSEDLDFDLSAEREIGLNGYCRKLAKGIEGYKIGEFRKVHSTLQFYCGFESPLGGTDHVRIDIAAKKIITQNPIALGTASSSYAGRSVAGVFVYSLEDLAARKLCALCVRGEEKDFYDVHNALPLCGRMRGAIAKMLSSEGSGQTAEEFLEKTAAAVKKADAKKLRNLANPFIPAGCRPKDWLELKNDLAMKLEMLE